MASIVGGGGGSEGRRWDGAEVDVAVVLLWVLCFVYLCASLDLLQSGKVVVGIGFESIRSGR